MDREHRGRQPCAAHLQSAENVPDEEGVEQVEHDIHEVIPERTECPDVVLEPEAREDERIVLDVRTEMGPATPQSLDSPQGEIVRHIDVVVPDEPTVEGGEVGSN